MAIQLLPSSRSSGYTSNNKSKMSQSAAIHQKPSSHLTSLPTEILSKIIAYTAYPSQKQSTRIFMPEHTIATPTNEHITLLPTLLTSKKLHHIALSQAYRAPVFDSLSSLARFTRQIVEQSSLGKSVRKLDLTSIPSTRTSTSHREKQNLLKDLLARTPLLREVYIGKSLANFINSEVLEILLCKLPFLEVLHLDSCTTSFPLSPTAITKSLTSLTLRNHSSTPNILSDDDITFWNALLPNLPRLQTLDVSHSSITSTALLTLPSNAELTYLNLSFCSNLLASEVVTFLTTHPSSLTALNLSQHPGTEAYLFPSEISTILNAVPSSPLQSLDLHSAAVASEHIPLLQKFQALEFLSLGGGVGMDEVERLVLGNGVRYLPLTERIISSTELSQGGVVKSVIEPLTLAVSRCKLRRRLNSITPTPSTPSTTTGLRNLKHINLTALSLNEQIRIVESVLLSEEGGLEVIELSEQAMSWNDGCVREVVGCVGWQARRDGRREWIARV